jgi:hypothetical protein
MNGKVKGISLSGKAGEQYEKIFGVREATRQHRKGRPIGFQRASWPGARIHVGPRVGDL